VEQQGNSFKARLEAAIWTSQLYVNDWWRQGAAPVQFGLRPLGGETWEVTVTNRLGKRIPSASLVLNGRLHELGELGPTNTFVLEFSKGTLATEYAVGRASAFSQAVEARRSQWARQGPSQALDPRTVAIAASFLEESPLRDQRYPNQGWRQTFAIPRSLDLTPNLKRGDAILLAWLPGETLVRPLNQFTPKRANYQTLLRVIKPAG